MKNIKAKLLSVLMVCAMILSFSACDSVNNKNSGSVASSSTSASDNSNGNSSAETDNNSNSSVATDSNGSIIDNGNSSATTDKNGSVVDNGNSSATTDKNGSKVDNGNSSATTDKNGSKVDSNSSSSSKADGTSADNTKKDPFTLTVGDAKGKAGDTVSVDISIKDNPGIAGMLVEIDYDKDAIQVVDNGFTKAPMIEDADAFLGNNKIYPNKVVWATTSDVLDNGVIVTMKFKIDKDAAKGDYEIKIVDNSIDICNANYKQLNPSTVAGKITVE